MLLVLALALSWSTPVPDASRQLVVVTTPSWSATDGTLRRYQREPGGEWIEVGEGVPVVVGRSGLGWGIGLHVLEGGSVEEGSVEGVAGPVKAEGDGRAPAGAFALSAAFGYAETERTGLPYIPSGPDLRCVDDPASRSYTLVRPMSPNADWQSHERMRRNDGLYRIGVIVAHNGPGLDPALAPTATLSPQTPTPGAGSCIFLHVWRGPGTSTAGCTAMPDERLQSVMAWLDADAAPTLIQLPASAAAALREPWGLP